MKKIRKKKIESKKTVITGSDGKQIEFDSKTEAAYYQYLIQNKEGLNIRDIELQKEFILMDDLNLVCFVCRGEKRVPSTKTGNLIKCRKCNATGLRKSNGAKYTADFVVTYNDGHREVIDVKGYANDSFSLRKRLFEHQFYTPLIVVKSKGKEWVRSD